VSRIEIEEPVLVLVGPTAIGKTALSLKLAEEYNCEIISVDSMQVYRYMDVGTAKATKAELERVTHHLIDIVEPDENYDATAFARDSLACIQLIHSKGKIPLLTGGTGLYLKALFEGIFPDAPSDVTLRKQLKQRLADEGPDVLHHELAVVDCISADKIHKNDSQRLLRALEVFHLTGKTWSAHLSEHSSIDKSNNFSRLLQVGLTCERQRLYDRINRRCEIMLDGGLDTEVKSLIKSGYGPELKPMKSIGYRHMCEYLNGNYGHEEMERLLARDTRRYAKRQYTWFNGMGDLQWVDVGEQEFVVDMVGEWLS
jgi:tRNA dimethylallyltransferase